MELTKPPLQLRHPRVSISVDRETGEEFSAQASNAGRTLSAFANEWLATASRISAEGGTARKTMDEWRVCSFFRDAEVIPLPAEFVEILVEGLCESDKAKALKTFGDLGVELVTLMKIYAPDIEGLSDLARGLAGVVPLKRLDVERLNDDTVVLSVVGAGRKFEVTECAYEFVKSILTGYGYSVTGHELGVGTIRVEAKRRTPLPERGPLPVVARIAD
jgi:hypothetical protein